MVINKTGSRNSGAIIWKCCCDCGSIHFATSSCLRNGRVKSCGCLRGLEPGEASFNHIYNQYKGNARRDKKVFDLTKTLFKDLTKQSCYYCGVEPNSSYRQKNCKGEYVYNGIDRKNNTIGYIYSNCVACCFICNIAKNNLTESRFQTWAIRFSNYQIRRYYGI